MVSLVNTVSPGGIGAGIANSFIGPTAPSYGTPGPVSSTRYFAGGGTGGATNIPGTPTVTPGGCRWRRNWLRRRTS